MSRPQILILGALTLQIGLLAACWGGMNRADGEWFPTFMLVDGMVVSLIGMLTMIGAFER